MTELLLERRELALYRIGQISAEEAVPLPYRSFFADWAVRFAWLDFAGGAFDKENPMASIGKQSLDTYKEENEAWFGDLKQDAYDTSPANPAYMAETMGEELGPILAALDAEWRGMPRLILRGSLEMQVAYLELFVEIYTLFAEEVPTAKVLKKIVYDFYYDYADVMVPERVRAMYDPEASYIPTLVKEADLTDLRYLYLYGEQIGENELRTAAYLNGLSEERIEALAFTYTDGYREGFELAGIDLSKKKYVVILYAAGQERILRAAIRQFEALGLTPVIFGPAVGMINRRLNRRSGAAASSVNPQYDFDHRFDDALFLDADLMQRKLEELEQGYEAVKDFADLYAGPAVIETFGEDPFVPESKKAALSYTEAQQKLSVDYLQKSSEIVNRYVHRDSYSFTIIAYPIPEIGEKFEEIFDRVVEINTLDKKKYRVIQEALIDALNTAEYVTVRGKDGNKTDMKVMMHDLADPEKETNFENCLADVNIPLGEVFTSPKLTGTEGTLHVSEVYLNGLKYKDLTLTFTDGQIASYDCANGDTPEEGRKFIKENLLANRDSLPIGEFAIGTNTTAYVMANRYDIVYKLPILIVEKMGPHFAIGDTCYSYSEDNRVFNPDGKEIVAKDNEISILRKEDPSKAYFNCHTDITIPYDEIGEIAAVTSAGEKTVIMKDGRFVLAGTEGLNEPFATGDKA